MKNLVFLFTVLFIAVLTSCEKESINLGIDYTDDPELYMDPSKIITYMGYLDLDDLEQALYLENYQCAHENYFDSERQSWVTNTVDCGYWHTVKLRNYWGEINGTKYYSQSKLLRVYVSPDLWAEIQYQFKNQNLKSGMVYLSNTKPKPNGEGLSISGFAQQY